MARNGRDMTMDPDWEPPARRGKKKRGITVGESNPAIPAAISANPGPKPGGRVGSPTDRRTVEVPKGGRVPSPIMRPSLPARKGVVPKAPVARRPSPIMARFSALAGTALKRRK